MHSVQRLSRNVVVLSWVSFFQDAASEMLYPILPLFLTGVLGASPAAVGLIEGVAEGLSSILKGISGRLADRMAKRPLVALGYGLSSVSKGLIALATGWPFVLFCRSLDRVGKGIRISPRFRFRRGCSRPSSWARVLRAAPASFASALRSGGYPGCSEYGANRVRPGEPATPLRSTVAAWSGSAAEIVLENYDLSRDFRTGEFL